MKLEIDINRAVEAIEKNLAEHVAELKEATDVWSMQMIEALEKFRDAVDRKGLEASHDELYMLMHRRPVDTRKEYSKYLGALKRAQTDGQARVTIDEDDYDRIFNDNWDWRAQSKLSNAGYTRKQ